MSQSQAPPQKNAAGFRSSCGLYDAGFEHDACGVGFIARLDARPNHKIVTDGVKILINLEHRGAIGGDKSTGDGAGLLFSLPDEFFRSIQTSLGFDVPKRGDYAVGMIFLPTDSALRIDCKSACENIAVQEGAKVLGWRTVPTENGHLGALARSTQPVIEQLFLSRGEIPKKDFERKLYIIRRSIEKQVAGWSDVDSSQFYIVTLSSRVIGYKGLLIGSQLPIFYADINDKKFKTLFSLVHQRFSTNTLPTWQLAQPFRWLAHNGEINTLRGNINRMRAREATIYSPLFGPDIEKIKPIIKKAMPYKNPNGSDNRGRFNPISSVRA